MAISASNQFTTTGFSYDASGNVLADGTNTYAWNAESEIKTATGVNYTYDGDGDRVQKSNGKIYWYGAGSEILDESDSSGNITDEYIFFGGKRIAHRVVSGNAIYYYAEDFLGSSRVMTTSTGTVCYDADFYPYGGERDVTNTCPQNYKFTGKERDAETNNDDFGARYYSSQFGRWISPDWSAIPAPVPYANLTNPQTLNLYSMVNDNPETFADLDGHDLTVAPALQSMVDLLRQQSPAFNAELAAHEGPGSPDLTIESGSTPNDPSGAPTDGNTTADYGWAGRSSMDEPDLNTYKGADVTLNSSIMGDPGKIQDVLKHEVGHVNHDRTDPTTAVREDQHTRDTHGATPHDSRPEEQAANRFKDRVTTEQKQFKKEQKELNKEKKRKAKELKTDHGSS